MIETIEVPESREIFNRTIKLNMSKDIIIKCSASWCGPCKRIQPYFNEYLNEYSKHRRVLFINIDFDSDKDICNHLRIKSIPTLLYYRKGELMSSFLGSDIEKLKNWFSNL